MNLSFGRISDGLPIRHIRAVAPPPAPHLESKAFGVSAHDSEGAPGVDQLNPAQGRRIRRVVIITPSSERRFCSRIVARGITHLFRITGNDSQRSSRPLHPSNKHSCGDTTLSASIRQSCCRHPCDDQPAHTCIASTAFTSTTISTSH